MHTDQQYVSSLLTITCCVYVCSAFAIFLVIVPHPHFQARECTELLLDEAYQDLRNSEKARKKLEAEVRIIASQFTIEFIEYIYV